MPRVSENVSWPRTFYEQWSHPKLLSLALPIDTERKKSHPPHSTPCQCSSGNSCITAWFVVEIASMNASRVAIGACLSAWIGSRQQRRRIWPLVSSTCCTLNRSLICCGCKSWGSVRTHMSHNCHKKEKRELTINELGLSMRTGSSILIKIAFKKLVFY